ncbi:uncharacterized protein LOC106648289 [Trichogramma pretiosum]|uniref:uncharacterized protein LOC106648289 n=1 Tax=Trichogramma pretiosum TaxID=7493 RepID=UPI0006C97988|nr:uncharacterized protein LOC106648289 [Trichogramma pretiosum]
MEISDKTVPVVIKREPLEEGELTEDSEQGAPFSVVIKSEPLKPAEPPKDSEQFACWPDLVHKVKVENEHSSSIGNRLRSIVGWVKPSQKRKFRDYSDNERDRSRDRSKRFCYRPNKKSKKNNLETSKETFNCKLEISEKKFKCKNCFKAFETALQVQQHGQDKHGIIQEIVNNDLNGSKQINEKQWKQTLQLRVQQKLNLDANNNNSENIKNDSNSGFLTKLRQFVNDTDTAKKNLGCSACYHNLALNNRIRHFVDSSTSTESLTLCQRFLEDFQMQCTDNHRSTHEILSCEVCRNMAELKEHIKDNIAFVELFISWLLN